MFENDARSIIEDILTKLTGTVDSGTVAALVPIVIPHLAGISVAGIEQRIPAEDLQMLKDGLALDQMTHDERLLISLMFQNFHRLTDEFMVNGHKHGISEVRCMALLKRFFAVEVQAMLTDEKAREKAPPNNPRWQETGD